jgi:hypothetical protein
MSVSVDWGYVVTTAQLVVVVLTSRTIHSFAIEMEKAVLIAAIMRRYSPFPAAEARRRAEGKCRHGRNVVTGVRLAGIECCVSAAFCRPPMAVVIIWTMAAVDSLLLAARFRTIWPNRSGGLGRFVGR